MSTHSITILKDEDGDKCVKMYRHHDGYPSYHGVQLAAFLLGKDIETGQPIEHAWDEPGDLAALMVSEFKSKVPNEKISLFAFNVRYDCSYVYEVYARDAYYSDIKVSVFVDHGEHKEQKIFEGTPEELLRWALHHNEIAPYPAWVIHNAVNENATPEELDAWLETYLA